MTNSSAGKGFNKLQGYSLGVLIMKKNKICFIFLTFIVILLIINIISNLFNISIDRLVKNDNCITNINNENIDTNELIEFLITAKKNTYASNNSKEIISSKPNSHDLIYENEKYKYFDSYFGGENFIGEEILYQNNIPIWGMNYCGIELNENFSSKFLKEALSNVTIDKPFRGPEIYQNGDYLYICKNDGNFDRFHGKEEIYFHKEKVYECVFHGGIIK